MKHTLKSAVTTTGRRMAGARSLWRANGMREEQFGRPVIGIANSFTQLVPGHVHLHEIGQYVKQRIEACGCFAAEFNTIAVDDGIAMGHDGMLYSLPSREIIADSVEYMASAHKIDALVCISNCDKITPGMLMAAMRLNIPTVFVSGGPMEAGKFQGRSVDLIDAMVMGADETCSDAQIAEIERCACPGCGSCSGMFTANSMNCLTEALGLSLPGNGTIVATHVNRRRLFEDAAALIVRNAERYYFEGDERVLPRSITTKAAFENAMSLDIAMGGSTNTVLHLLAVAHEAGVDFTMSDIDRLSRRIPVICKVAPNSHYHIQDVNRAGGILSILGELNRGGLIDTAVDTFGGVDVLICNAGISMRALFDEVDLAVLHKLMDVNFWGCVNCTKYALPYIQKARGSIVGVSSVAGIHGLPGRTGYSASKYAMTGFLETIRIENRKKGVHVMIACPGFTASNVRFSALTADGSQQGETPREEGKMMTAEEVARIIARAVVRRKRLCLMEFQGRATHFVKKFWPSLLDRLFYWYMSKEPDSPFK